MAWQPTILATSLVFALAAPALADGDDKSSEEARKALKAMGEETASLGPVRAFKEHLKKAKLRAGLDAKLDAELEAVSKHEYIHQALMQLNDSYAAAVRSVRPSSPELKGWLALLETKPDAFVEAEARYRLGRTYLLRDDYEKAAEQFELLERKLASSTTRVAESRLFLAYAYGKLEDTGRARRILADMIQRYPDAPERYTETAHWFLRELKGEGSGPLIELSKSMETIKRFLKRQETGFNPTQDRQERVVKELDRLIKLMEEKQKSGKGKGKGRCKKCQGKPKACKSCQKAGKKPSNPMNDSKLPGGSNDVGSLKPDAKPSAETWGKLKKLERSKVLQVLKEQFPSQYKELIEQYYRSFHKEGSGN